MTDKIYELKIDKDAYLEATIKYGKNLDALKLLLKYVGYGEGDEFFKDSISLYEYLETTIKTEENVLKEIWNTLHQYIYKYYEKKD